MKKLICLLLAALLTLMLLSAALAGVEAYYQDGKVTLTTGEEGFWEVSIDGKPINRWVGSGHPTGVYPMALEDGEHTAAIDNGKQTLTAVFWVGDEQPQAENAEPEGATWMENISYTDGAVTFQVSGLRGYAEIWIDGVNTSVTVYKDGEQRLEKPLSEGGHTLALYLPAYDEVVAADFSAADFSAGAPADQDEPETETPADPKMLASAEPEGDALLENVVYATGVVSFQVSGLRGYAEIWIDGANTGATVKENGEQCVVKLLSEGGHTLALYLPAYDEAITVDFTAVSFSPKAEALREILSALVKNEAGEVLGSGLAIDMNEISYLLRVSVDNKKDAVLTLTREQIAALLEQGLNLIEYVNGNASLRVDLTKVTNEWFGTEAPVSAYCFVLIPGENGARVTVYATTGEGNVEADAFSGLTLISGGKRVTVKQNGVY